MKRFGAKVLLVMIFSLGLHLLAGAQTDPPPDDPDLVPLDPGSWVLVAAGVGYGVKKWKENKQKNKADITEPENEITK